MSDTQESLKSQNHRIAEEYSQPPSGPTDDDRRREEEDMQRAIAESETLSKQTATGYVRSQPPSTSSSALPNRSTPTASTSNYLKSLPQSPSDLGNPTDGPKRPKRVIALYEFDSSTEEELPFKKGEIINVVECAYTEWWRGELRGKIGIFPANYVVSPPPSLSSFLLSFLLADGSRDIIGGCFRWSNGWRCERGRSGSSTIFSVSGY
jgi:signal transducing adaptor molecule